MRTNRAPSLLWIIVVLCAASTEALAQMLETETSRLQPARTWEVGSAFEYQTSGDASEQALPIIIEYGVTDALELTLEPVAYTAIRPASSMKAVGPGDMEFTVTYLFARETQTLPAISLAGEVKFPTASNALIGTGEPDYALYLVGSKRYGAWDLSANLGFTVLGGPPEINLGTVFNGAFAAVYHASSKLQLFSEVFGNTASNYNGEAGTAPPGSVVVPEAIGSELVGTLGAAYNAGSGLLPYLGVSYDTNGALLIRPGFTYNLP